MVKISMTGRESCILELVCRNNAGLGGTKEMKAEEWNHLANKFAVQKDGE